MDTTSKGLSPKTDSHPVACLYLISFIAIICFFILNLVVGVMVERFNQMSGRGMFTPEQLQIKDMLVTMLTSNPSPMAEKPEVMDTSEAYDHLRVLCYDICTNKCFEWSVIGAIILNTVLMMTEHAGQPSFWDSALEWANGVSSILFTIEMLIRLIGLSPKYYFNDPWNVFDFFVVVGCDIALILFLLGSNAGGFKVSAVRPLRLLLLFRVLKMFRGVRLMVTTLITAFPALLNVISLCFLLFFFYAVIGVQLFANVKFGGQLGPHANFRTFDKALSVLSRMLTGENWQKIMHDCMVEPPMCTKFSDADTDCGSSAGAIIYFVSFFIFSSYMIMNLFVAIILDNFSVCLSMENSFVSEEELNRFQNEWFRRSLAYVQMQLKREAAQQLRSRGPVSADAAIRLMMGETFDTEFNMGKYLPLYEVKKLIQDTPPPLGRMGTPEARQFSTTAYEEMQGILVPGCGLHLQRVQHILCLHAAGLDALTFEDWVTRKPQMQDYQEGRAARMMQSLLKGRLGRLKVAKRRVANEDKAVAGDVWERMMQEKAVIQKESDDAIVALKIQLRKEMEEEARLAEEEIREVRAEAEALRDQIKGSGMQPVREPSPMKERPGKRK